MVKSYFKITNKNDEDIVVYNLNSNVGKIAFMFGTVGIITVIRRVLSFPKCCTIGKKKRKGDR